MQEEIKKHHFWIRLYPPLLVVLFIFGKFGWASDQGTNVFQGIRVQKGLISANMTDTPLAEIFEQIDQQCDIEFGCDASLLGAKVTVRFEAQDLANGLRRILANMNHSILYDQKGIVKRVLIFGLSDEVQGQVDDREKLTPSGVATPQTRPSGPSFNRPNIAGSFDKKQMYQRPSRRFGPKPNTDLVKDTDEKGASNAFKNTKRRRRPHVTNGGIDHKAERATSPFDDAPASLDDYDDSSGPLQNADINSNGPGQSDGSALKGDDIQDDLNDNEDNDPNSK